MGKKTTTQESVTGQRERPDFSSLGNGSLSEVSRDGLQGVLSCAMDVHILERGTHQCQIPCKEICVYTCFKIAVVI